MLGLYYNRIYLLVTGFFFIFTREKYSWIPCMVFFLILQSAFVFLLFSHG